tara:strand:- start:24042 stop:24263 length:222 start_codon:yes stop_codon:yes gene_type:complete
MSKEPTLNIASQRVQSLINHLTIIETNDRDKLSQASCEQLDKIWKLLKMPTYEELEKWKADKISEGIKKEIMK